MRPFNALEWQMATRYLRARRREGFISVIAGISFLGIMLGVGTLIVVMAVMTGFRADLLERILGVNGHIMVRSYDDVPTDKDGTSLVTRLQNLPDVVLATPIINGQAMLSTGNAVQGVLVRGLPENKIKNLPSLAGNITHGTLDGLDKNGGVVIGGRLAERYGFGVGDQITLIAPRGTVTPFGVTPNIKRFSVVAIFNIGLSDYDLNFIFASLATGTRFFGFADSRAQNGTIELTLTHPDIVDKALPFVRQVLGDGRYQLIDWRQSNRTLAGALEVERNVMFLILTLILLVASLNIISGMVMLVRDKGRDIAVLRSIGAARGMVMRVFFLTGASIGVVGTLAGLLVGTIFCIYIEEVRQFLIWSTGAQLFPAEVYFLDEMPAQMVPADIMMVVGMALTLSFLSTLYPAWRAASLQPVEALRYE